MTIELLSEHDLQELEIAMIFFAQLPGYLRIKKFVLFAIIREIRVKCLTYDRN
jgi:hypothetical protein